MHSEQKPVCAHRITGRKTCDNRPLKNEVLFRIARLYVGSKIVCFYESNHAFKTIWWRPCSCNRIKIKGYFLKLGRPVFIIVINTSCSGVCYRIYTQQKFLNNALMALWHYLEFLLCVYPATNALTIGIYSYNRST